MNLKLSHLILVKTLLMSSIFLCQNNDSISGFEEINNTKNWKKVFYDHGDGHWQDKWFLDGKLATITNSKKGMNFSAGTEDKNDAHHAVLWTKKSFKGDVKITYDYTRNDEESSNVCILYIQATGTGEAPYDSDISKWNDLRKIPAMSTYFNHMNTIHISYAAFTNKGEKYDYVRARHYPTSENVSFSNTEIPPSYDNVGFFETGITYHITAIKTKKRLSFLVEGEKGSRLFSWDTSDFNPITEGRIGLRHMYTRSATYRNFKIYTNNSSNK